MLFSVNPSRAFWFAWFAVMVTAASGWAAPARVSVFEAPVHEKPSSASKQLQMLEENKEISVSEEVTDGWRRVRLGDGRQGWVQERNIRLLSGEKSEKMPTVSPTAAPSGQNTSQSTRIPPPPAPPVSVYVKDLDHLAELTRPDSVVFPMASKLASRQTTSRAMYWGGTIVGSLLLLGSFTVFASEDCYGSDSSYCSKSISTGALTAGAVVSIVGLIGGLALSPSRNDLLDVINTWNGRHPGSQFSLDREVSQR